MQSLFKWVDKALHGGNKAYKNTYKDEYKNSYEGGTEDVIKMMNESGNRRTSLFGGTAKYNNTGNRQDKTAQQSIQADIAAGKKISMNAPQSSRFQISKEEQEKRGLSKQGTLYTADDVADMKVDTNKEVPVASSAVQSFDYDPKSQALNVKFVGGNKKYLYPNVPPEVVTEFMDAPSKGKYMNYVIGPQYSTNK